jgi:hypothetical protein
VWPAAIKSLPTPGLGKKYTFLTDSHNDILQQINSATTEPERFKKNADWCLPARTPPDRKLQFYKKKATYAVCSYRRLILSRVLQAKYHFFKCLSSLGTDKCLSVTEVALCTVSLLN